MRFALGDEVMAAAIRLVRGERGAPVLVSLAGPQGSGKSTTAARLTARLEQGGLRVAAFSLDDCYLTRAERQRLADEVHPLLATRGVPGTHDVDLLGATVSALLAAGEGDLTPIPRFDKAIDDRADPSRWPQFGGAADVVLVEGWCMGARQQPADMLVGPVNALEHDEDAGGGWRSFVNDQLAGPYACLFARFDLRLQLRAPDFGLVHRWRGEQEAALARTPPPGAGLMDHAALARFIAHYQRLTEWMSEDEPADIVIDIDEARAPLGWRVRQDCPRL